MSSARLRCPLCQGEFDYDYVIGASFSAVRLGAKRYMACPLCRRWATFDLGASPAAGTAPPAPVRRFSDSRLVARRLPWLVVPVAVGILAVWWLPTDPTLAISIDIAAAAAVVLFGFLVIRTARLPEEPPRPIARAGP